MEVMCIDRLQRDPFELFINTKEVQSMKKRIFLFLLALVLCLTACQTEPPAVSSDPTTVPTTEHTQTTAAPTETTVPPTTAPVAPTIAWREPDSSRLYSFEDYYRFERIFNGGGEDLWEFIRAEDGIYTPCFEDGLLCLTNGTLTFPISQETYTQLRIFGTDGTRWIYCASSGTELFRIDPLGKKEILYHDDTGRIDRFRLEDLGNIAFLTAGAGEGYGIYRIHLPSMEVELLVQEQEPINLLGVISNYRIEYFVETDPEGNVIKKSTPAKEWDLSDLNIQMFQKLLTPGESGVLNAYNNWYNAATFVAFDRPEEISLSALMKNGFRDLPTRLTEEELAALGSQASGSKDYFKLPGKRVEAVLKMLTGLRIEDLDQNTLMGGKTTLTDPILYLEKTDTYYAPCPMKQKEGENFYSIYIFQQDIEVHLVERNEDGTYRVYYMSYTPAPFWSSTDLEEKVMVLKQTGDGWHILSNGPAVLPMPS